MKLHETFLHISLCIAFISCYYQSKEKTPLSLWLLFIAGLCIRMHMIYLDQFLHDWDEKYHALVARNLMYNPLKPMLYVDTIIPKNFTSWTNNHIWLHKQPMFMWQMALSMKIFGINEISIRYPSALLGAIMPILLYRITYIMSKDKLFAFAAALFMCFSNYHLELISGVIGMDHNDVIFGFYVLASVWAYAEYISSGKLYFILLIGLFAGFAVLTKWLAGMMVFGGWFLNILLNIKHKNVKKDILYFFVALVICAAIFVPWQLYILDAFPVEAKHEFAYNSLHIFEVVENHGGEYNYYFKKLSEYFGTTIWWVLLIGIITLTISDVIEKRIKYHILFSSIVVFSFFSFVAATKMQSYMFILAPFCYMMIVHAALYVCNKLRIHLHGIYILLFFMLVYNFNYSKIVGFFHSPFDKYREGKTKNTLVYKSIRKHIPSNVKYVFNLSEFAAIDLMFFNPDITAYDQYVTEEQFKIFKDRNIPVAVFADHNKYKIPDFIKNYPNTHIINIDLGDL